MTKMPVAFLAHNFYSAHAEGDVRLCLHRSFEAFIKCRPSTSALELRLGGIERIAASCADEVPFW
eukprot:CAMPEP_0196666502 /NCGR_PEP_ID=MMETSP1086-20130531/64543_1 /TAXON_ID=77921 /ORGANISM="Cyanoptyche  gloeocystis , Strain SAG4.97" /LENGTH=64 /DNA_ID=CAMNT_0042003697 /DNA_START=1093 /DNA_END=1284 /DNA_ORIENTATION=+